MATKLSLKLLVDKKNHKVLFGEANKDFVDFLFGLMALPIGSVIRLLTEKRMVGCLGRLYESIENLSDTYIQPNQDKNSLLKPKPSAQNLALLLSEDSPTTSKKYYSCSPDVYYNRKHSNLYISEVSGTVCPDLECSMDTEVMYVVPNNTAVASSGGEGGFVKGVVTYMVMDDLAVTPMSTISSITLLNKFNIKEVGTLEEMVVDVGLDEGLALLNASLQSKTALSDVFLGKVDVPLDDVDDT
ncbi:uncharacterized protein LOC143884952 [Tasmannia lanceolata]|uniref:uncharacterized protein LOC143884952 n=1 Tax=Tasmannia lanceolata TaxID=3420 RepID=UPI0040638E73